MANLVYREAAFFDKKKYLHAVEFVFSVPQTFSSTPIPTSVVSLRLRLNTCVAVVICLAGLRPAFAVGMLDWSSLYRNNLH